MRKTRASAAIKAERGAAIAHECPECKAPAGSLCIGRTGSTRQAPHRGRMAFVRNAGLAITPALRVVGTSDETRAEELLNAACAIAAADIRDTYAWASSRCESPIERILVAEYLNPRTGQNWGERCELLVPPSGLIEHCAAPPMEGFYLWPQIKIGPYRVDFVFGARQADGEMTWAIIECDGHDFHEKTRGQAQRDKARDRYLIGRGYRVLRFTGSEVYRQPHLVWDEIVKILLGLCD